MESKLLLIDPTSSTSSRVFFTIPAGLKYFTRKLRLLNFRVLNLDGRPIYFGLNGIYSLVKNITIANLQGTVIDQLGASAISMMGFRNIHQENATSQYLGRQLLQNMCVSVSCPSASQLCLTETEGKDSAGQIYAHLDISSMLNYLQVRAIADEGLQISIEWQEQLSPVNGGYYFSVPPCLAIDEVLGNLPVDKQEAFVYTSIIPNGLNIPVNLGGESQIDTRLNSYINCYIKNILYFNGNQQKNAPNSPAGHFNRVTYMPYAVQNERLEISIDGKYLMTTKGLNTDARKLQATSDWSGEFCLPSAPSYYYGVVTESGAPYGLVNPNTDLVMNGNVSYGCFGVNQFVKDNFQVIYSGQIYSEMGQPSVQQLFFLAETLRTYSRKSGTVSNVFAPVKA